MPRVTIINTCLECPHIDHSGGFTKGGAKRICGHGKIVECRGSDWEKRVLPDQKGKHIPSWCPLIKVKTENQDV